MSEYNKPPVVNPIPTAILVIFFGITLVEAFLFFGLGGLGDPDHDWDGICAMDGSWPSACNHTEYPLHNCRIHLGMRPGTYDPHTFNASAPFRDGNGGEECWGDYHVAVGRISAFALPALVNIQSSMGVLLGMQEMARIGRGGVLFG